MNLSNYLKFQAVLVLLITLSINLHSQPFRVGRISVDDFRAIPYEKDPEASAVFLYDYGKTHIKLHHTTGRFVYEFERSFRIQILNEDGLDWADFSQRLYNTGLIRETLTGFRAYVHNIEGNRVRSTRLKRRSPITENTTDNYRTWKLTFPEVKVGSIIELRYTITSPRLFTLTSWRFQYTIPVEHSELITIIPEYFSYRTYLQGYQTVSSLNTAVVNDNIHFRGHSLTSSSIRSTYIMKDVPAIRPESYTNNINNYLSIMHFELSSEIFPMSSPVHYASTWNDVDKLLRDDENFGGYMSGSRRLRREIFEFIDKDSDELSKIRSAIEYLNNNVRWNDRSSHFTSSNPNQVLRQGTGNSAEINLLLVAILNEVGINAFPVVSSTRRNGLVIPVFPTITRFNYVLVAAETKEHGLMLLDATDEYCPVGWLPPRLLNGQGRLIKDNRAMWVDLKPAVIAERVYEYNVKINEEKVFTGNAKWENSGYASYNTRSRILRLNDDDKYLENLKEDISGIQINSFIIENRDEIYEPLIRIIDFDLTEGIQEAGDLLLFYPLLFERLEDNPFRIEERLYPVDFTHPFKNDITVKFDIPDDYAIDFVPSNVRFNIRNTASYSFNTNINEEGQLEVRSILDISSAFVTSENYQELKDFFSKVVEKQSEQVVLKQITE